MQRSDTKCSSCSVRLILVLLAAVTGCSCLEITRLSIPNYVLNGSQESVLLDCEYSYDLELDKKMVIKWFHEDDPEPVYQWIPELDTILHSERYRINTDYVVPSGDPYTRSRALNILRPTTELSGKYSCQVTSTEDSDTQEACMVVYALPTSVNLNYTTVDDTVIVFCEVEGIFPLPEMSMFQIEPGKVLPTPVDDVEMDYELMEGGSYDVILATNISQGELATTDGLRFFGCTVIGPEYEKVTKVPYFPDPIAEKQEGEDSDTDGGSCLQTQALIVAFFSLLLLFT